MIAGKIVVLKPAMLSDRRQVYAWLALSDITSRMMGPPDFMDNPVPTWADFTDDYNPHFFDDLYPYSGRSFIIEVNNQAVGHINYNDIDRNTGTVELDVWLAGSEHCNKGYGTDAINTLCEYLTAGLQCRRFILAPSARNKAAVKAYEKCGFKTVKELPQNIVSDYYDTVVMLKEIPGK